MNSDGFARLFTDDVPLIDVRAPVEFASGALPAAVNLPILDNNQREQIGICYKNEGPQAATRLGHTLVSGQDKQLKVESWVHFLRQHPGAHLYCFRGGQRSGIACEWILAEGISVPRIEGGYKACRRFLLSVLEQHQPMMNIAGKTGTGKTDLLVALPNHIDLEGIARHRGSAFGGTLTPQPAQIDFENAVAVALLKQRHQPGVFIEDESRLIGRIHVPPVLQAALARAPIMLLEDTLANRVERIHRDYIVAGLAEYTQKFGAEGAAEFGNYLTQALVRIRKRLGGARHTELMATLSAALAAQDRGDDSAHRDWIRALLSEYYDPMYEYQLTKKEGRIIVRGDVETLKDWALSNEVHYG